MERHEIRVRLEEAEERRQRDAVAIVPYSGRPYVGPDGAGPSRVRSDIPEEEMPLRKRPRLSVIPEEPIEWRDIHMTPTPVPPVPVPSPIPSPLPSPDPFEDPVEQFTPPGHFILSEDELEEDPSEDADTEPVPPSPPFAPPPPPPVDAPPLVDVPPPVAMPPQEAPIFPAGQLPAILLSEYFVLQGQLEESRRTIDTLVQRLDRARGGGGVIPDGLSLGIVSIELRALGDIRTMLGDRGDPVWRAQIVDVVTTMVVQIRDVIRASLP